MTHEYTILTGGTILPGGDAPTCSAIAWAADTVLALGTDDAVRGISRGDSHIADLDGRFVVPLAPDGAFRWPLEVSLEPGGPADLAVLDGDPRGPSGDLFGGSEPRHPRILAIIRRGRVVDGDLAGLEPEPAGAHPDPPTSPADAGVADPDPPAVD